jgi:dipeptide transport system ATP-binding protein
MTIVAQARDLKRVYAIRRGIFKPPAQLQAVGGVSFALEAGKTLAVVGESGCGKSTLARMVSLIERPSSGSFELDGIDTTHGAVMTAAQTAQMRRTVQLVFQNPYSSLNPRKKISAILEDPLTINMPFDKAERAHRAREMLAQVGLRPEYANRYPHMFSGGQRQRIAIARALMLSPKLVVADEPVSALDVSIQAQVLNLLADLQQQLGLAYLFISHDLAVVRHIAHDVLVMYLGHAVEQGPKAKIFAMPLHPYTQALLASTPGVGLARQGVARVKRIVLKGELPSPLNPPMGCVFSTRCPHVQQRCIDERPLQRPVDERLVACHYAEQIAEQILLQG